MKAQVKHTHMKVDQGKLSSLTEKHVSVYSPSGLDHFLCYVVEEVPAAEGEGGLQEGQSDLTH